MVGLLATWALCSTLSLTASDLGILPLAALVALPGGCWVATQRGPHANRRELILAFAAGALAAGPLAHALIQALPTSPEPALLDHATFSRWLYAAAGLGVASEATKYAMVRLAFAPLARKPLLATSAIGLGFACYASYAAVSAAPAMHLGDAAQLIVTTTLVHRSLAAVVGAAIARGSLATHALGLALAIALSAAASLARHTPALMAGAVAITIAALAIAGVAKDSKPSVAPSRTLALLACAAAIAIAGTLTHASLTRTAFMTHREQGLTFARPAHWLVGPKAVDQESVRASFTNPSDPSQHIEFRIRKRPSYPGLGLALDLEKLARHGSYYRAQSESTATLRGLPWLRTAYHYARSSDVPSGLSRAEAIEYALAAGGRLWVVTLHGKPGTLSELDAKLAASLTYQEGAP